MTIHALATYTIRIYEGGTPQHVDNFSSHHDLLLILEDYMNNLQSAFHQDPGDDVVLHVRELERKGRLLQGRLGKGVDGVESDLFNTRKKVLSYSRVSEDAELMPYYFLFAVPKNSVDAIAIFQMTDGNGIQGDFEDHFKDLFEAKFPALRIAVDRLRGKQSTSSLLRRGNVTHVHMVKRYSDIADLVGQGPKKTALPQDVADLVESGMIEEKGSVAYTMKPTRGEAPGKAAKNMRLRELLSSGKFNDFEVKLQLEADGKSYTLNLSDQKRNRAPYIYDITKELGAKDKTSDYARLKEIAEKLCLKMADHLGLSI